MLSIVRMATETRNQGEIRNRKTKAKLYPRVRNKFNVNKPIYESEGTVYVNLNTFIRVKMVLDEIQRLTKTDSRYTKLLKLKKMAVL